MLVRALLPSLSPNGGRPDAPGVSTVPSPPDNRVNDPTGAGGGHSRRLVAHMFGLRSKARRDDGRASEGSSGGGIAVRLLSELEKSDHYFIRDARRACSGRKPISIDRFTMTQ